MDAYFTDPDDDPLTYTAAASGQAGTVTALASGDTVWLVPGAAGTATVTVTATDRGGLSATQTIAVTVAVSAGPRSDREVLEVFYNSTGGDGWTNRTNWKTSAPLDEWFGVTVDAEGRVTELELYANELMGPIPTTVGQLVNLRTLNLGLNGLTGPIPNAVADLTNLRSLNLSGNALTGSIPAAAANLTNLRSLNLGKNDLSGPAPSWLGNLDRLVLLDLSGNGLTGPIPQTLGRLTNLGWLDLSWNGLTGPIPSALENLENLGYLRLHFNDLTGPLPAWLGNLVKLRWLHLHYNWGLSGPLPAGLVNLPELDSIDIFITQSCASAAWREWLETIEFTGRLCETRADVTIDVAVFHTPAAREEAGGTAAIAAVIDLMVAETNQAYAESGVNHRLRLVERSEVQYAETGDSYVDSDRLRNPADGHMDEVHAVRDQVGADLVHLIANNTDVSGLADTPGPFGLTRHSAGGGTFAHELGHNLGLLHDRNPAYDQPAHPAYGYVNQPGLAPGAAQSRRWSTIMAYQAQCSRAYTRCPRLLRFSNPRQHYNGDPLGVPHGAGSGVIGAADAAAVLNVTAPMVALWRDRPTAVNRPPNASGVLPDRALSLPATLVVDVSAAFVDPDGDALTYTVSLSSPDVVAVMAAGARLTLTAVSEGTATIRVTATDPGGLSATQAFRVTVEARVRAPFTDDPIVPGVTPVKAVHFTELRTRVDALRSAAGLARFSWSDPALRVGVTPVRRVHLLELRSALAQAYRASGRASPRWTDTSPTTGPTPIRALHLTELRAAVLALE